MKVLFINPFIPLERSYGRYARFGAILPPYGMACIASYARARGVEARIIDANRHAMSVAEVVKAACSWQPDLIGLYATTLGSPEALSLARALRPAVPHAKLILGGPHAIGNAEKLLDDEPTFDFVCAGEGELAVIGLLRALESGRTEFNDIPGLCWRNGTEAVRNAISEVINLDDVPSPAREIGDLKGYHQKIFSFCRTPFAVMQTSRGCPYNCIFCSSPMHRKTVHGGKIRYHSLAWIEAELDYLVREQGASEVYFLDDTFNITEKRVVEICELILRRFPGLMWSCNFEVNVASREMLSLMQRAGCWSIMIGVESGSQKILDAIQKGITIEQVLKVSDWCYELGLMGRASFILGHPGETRETMRQTIALARRVRLPFVTFSLMTPLPGSRLQTIADRFGEVRQTDDGAAFSRASFIPFGLTAAELEAAQIQAHRSVFLSPRRNFRLMRYLFRRENREVALSTVQRVAASFFEGDGH
ncbi:MAG: B12-binding domain-containing radical SAM protein [Candidatus Riflebacteria bacterium]|nr:B12-binding domain-containing radical SAM protein [Candidatus Riflebacteria bacterium]